MSNFVQPHYANIIDIFDILDMLSKHYFPTENINSNLNDLQFMSTIQETKFFVEAF